MATIKVDVPEDIEQIANQLDKKELSKLIIRALREKASEEMMFDLADQLLEQSELNEEEISHLADRVKEHAADRHNYGQ